VKAFNLDRDRPLLDSADAHFLVPQGAFAEAGLLK